MSSYNRSSAIAHIALVVAAFMAVLGIFNYTYKQRMAGYEHAQAVWANGTDLEVTCTGYGIWYVPAPNEKVPLGDCDKGVLILTTEDLYPGKRPVPGQELLLQDKDGNVVGHLIVPDMGKSYSILIKKGD